MGTDVSQMRALTDALRQELDEIEQSAASLKNRLSFCENKIAELKGETEIAEVLDAVSDVDRGTQLMLPRGRVRLYVEQAMYSFGERGASVADLQQAIATRHLCRVQSNTISVTLSRLKRKGLARLEGMHWHPDTPEDDEAIEARRAAQALEIDEENEL